MLPKRLPFRFSAPCFHREKLWTARGARLGSKYRLPDLAELEGRPSASEVRVAWSVSGLAFSVHVGHKEQPPWCRASRGEDSDGVQLWIDTRDTHTVHRATRFCHRFLFLPCGSGSQSDPPSARWLPIHRAREHPRAIPSGQVQVQNQMTEDGYVMDILLGAESLTGFDPAEHPRLGFHYAIIDRELGEQTFAIGGPMPYREDPSLWATLELVK